MKKSKFVVSLFLVVAILMTLCIAPITANAVTSQSVNIVFYKPDNWGDNINIHLWNAGSENTQWPGIAMTQNTDGTYTYTSSNISSCNFVINDGTNQTSDLYAEGYVGVKDNKVFAKSINRILVCFKKPADWSDNINIYYYSNDSGEVSFMNWPGVSMGTNETRDGYHYYISDMADVRVLFTDGVHQYPAAGVPGIPVSAGQELVFDEDKYTVNDYNWYNVDQPTTCAYVGEDYHINYIFTKGDDFPLSFYDEDGNLVRPVSKTYVYRNDKVYADYVFNFSETGSMTLYPYYYYHSSSGYLGKSASIDVLPTNTSNNSNEIYADKYCVNLGETFTITVANSGEYYYYFADEDGNEVSYDYSYSSFDGNGSYTNYVFTADKLGQYQKFICGLIPNHSPYSRVLTDNFVTINVWNSI